MTAIKTQKGWPEIRLTNTRSRVPWGYERDEADPFLLKPVQELIMLAEKAMDLLDKGNSLRETTDWLKSRSGTTLSHMTLSNIWKRNRGDQKTGRTETLKKRKAKALPKTKAERDALKDARKLSAAKRTVTLLTRKEEQADREILGPAPDDEEPVFRSPDLNAEIIFEPNPGPQTDFLAATEMEILFGGSAGGGKSYAMLADPMRYFGNKNFNGLIVRRTNDELRELIWKSQEMYPKAYPGARWQEKKSQWVFPSGAKLWMSYLERDEDVLRYQGLSFCVAEGTPVLMADGSLKAIEDLQVGELVETLEGPKPITFLSDPLAKDLVEVTVYDAAGHLVCEQIQPDSHPIAQLSEVPYRSLRDLCRTIEQYKLSPLSWLSHTPHESRHRESLAISSSSEDDPIPHKGCEHDNLDTQRPQPLFYPVVLHGPSLLSALGRDATRSLHACKSSPQSQRTCRDSSGSSSDHSPQPESSQSKSDRTYATHLPEVCGALGAQPDWGTVADSPNRCSTCHHQCGGPLQQGSEGAVDVVPSLDGAEGLDRSDLLSDGTDCTPLRTRYLTSSYSHPYTREQRPLEGHLELGIVRVQPKVIPGKFVREVSISEVNHYITFGGIINKNCYVGFDELTQHPTPFAYNYMRSRLRTTDPTLPLCFRSTSNPGGPGHGWVKKMFIDPAPWGKSFPATDIDTGQPLVYPKGHAKEGQPLFTRRFIPSKLSDNPYLTADGQYEANLLSLPEMQRRQLLEGDWSVTAGAAFPEFQRSVHVTEPFEIPENWRRFRSCDYGYSSHSAVHWYAIDPAYETLIVYRELYTTKQTGRALAKLVLEAEQGENISYGVLDSSCWHQRGQVGPSIAEEMIAAGCRWRPSDRTAGARVNGKNRLHEVLKTELTDTGIERPGIIFFNTCVQIIADLPMIPTDPKGSDDIDPRYASDHAYDSIRYGIMSRPRSSSPFEESFTRDNTYRPVNTTFGY